MIYLPSIAITITTITIPTINVTTITIAITTITAIMMVCRGEGSQLCDSVWRSPGQL